VLDGSVAMLILTKKNGCVSGITTIDAEDLPRVRDYRWNLHKKGYVVEGRGKRLSRLVMQDVLKNADGLEVDHIDHNKLNNRKSNLRICTTQQNLQNRKLQRNNKTGYKGVHLTASGRYQARIGIDCEEIHLGCFDTAKEAAKAYNKAAMEHFGEFAYLNST
jgi:hypothetical protein